MARDSRSFEIFADLREDSGEADDIVDLQYAMCFVSDASFATFLEKPLENDHFVCPFSLSLLLPLLLTQARAWGVHPRDRS